MQRDGKRRSHRVCAISVATASDMEQANGREVHWRSRPIASARPNEGRDGECELMEGEGWERGGI